MPILASVPLTTIAEDGARTADDTVTITVDSACAMTATVNPNNPHTATIDPSVNKEGIGETTFKTICNDGNGHAIYAIGFSNDTEGDTDLHHTDGTNKITTDLFTSGDTSAWAMKLTAVTGTGEDFAPEIDYASSYAVIPNTYTKVAHFNGTTDQSTGSKFTSTYRAYASPTQPAGSYVGKVRYVLLHPNDYPEVIHFMQDITPEYIANMQAGITETMVDKRDMKTYTVAKLKDGNVWMTQDLALGGSSTIELTPENSDLNTGTRFILPVAQTSGSSDWDDQNFSGARYINGEEITIGQKKDGNHVYDNDSATDPTSGNPIGNHYTYWTATAGSGGSLTTDSEATESICPKGWKLPSGGKIQNLYDQYGSYDSFTSDPTLNFTFSGNYFGGAGYFGSSAGWWSKSARAASLSYALSKSYDAESITPSLNIFRYLGYSVRCVASDS